MLNINQGDLVNVVVSEEDVEFENNMEINFVNNNVWSEDENVEMENENVDLGNENVDLGNDNEWNEDENVEMEIENVDLGNENFPQEPHERYTSPNYMRNEVPCNKDNQYSNSGLSRTPKWLIEIEENIINNLEGKRSHRTVRLWASRLYDHFFGNKTLVEQCQIFMRLLKMQKMRPMLVKLKIRVNKKMERNAIVLKNIFNALNSIGKTRREKNKRVARRVITTSLVSHQLRKARLMRQTCVDFNIDHKTLGRALSRRERLDDLLQIDTWAYGGRRPYFDKKLTDVVKDEIQQFWDANSRVSPNLKDVLKLRVGNQHRTPHPKHYVEVSQTMLYKKICETHPTLKISQRSFEFVKPFYCVPLKIRSTCCCKYHVEFSMHHELLWSIHSTLHTNEMLEDCGASGLPKSSRDLLDQFLCHRDDGCLFYKQDCLNAKCLECGGLSKFRTCFHEGLEHNFGKTLIQKKVYETLKYTLKSGGEGSRCELASKEYNVADFISDFKTNLFYKYARHSHKSQWLDQQFRTCKGTFPIGTIISIVDFVEKYTLQPQNETQAQYYNSIQVAIFVHITYRHSPDSTKYE